MKLGRGANVIKQAGSAFLADSVPTLGAALAYYAIFSIGPLLVIIVGVAGMVFSDAGAREQLHGYLQSLLGQSGADLLNSMMASQSRTGGLITVIIGFVTLVLGASGIFGQLKSSLNRIWHVTPRPGRAVWAFLVDRAAALGMILLIGLLLIASMLLTTMITALSEVLEQYLPMPSWAVQVANLGASLLLMTVLFALIFKVMPDIRIQWRAVWIGGLVTAALFLVGQYLLSLYLGRRGAASAYGAAGSVVLILMWIYYSALILLAGAEVTKAYARETGARVEPGRFGVPQPSAA